MLVVEPTSPVAYYYLAFALAANGAPQDSVRQTLARRFPLYPKDISEWARLGDDAFASLTEGDLTLAEAKLAAQTKDATRFDPSEIAAAVLARYRIEALLESGDATRAAEVARRYLDSLPGLMTDPAMFGIARPFALGLLHRRHVVDDARFRSLRDEWVEAITNPPPDHAFSKGNAKFAFLDAYAAPAATRDEALEALDVMPRLSPEPLTILMTPFPQGDDREGHFERARGSMYFLAGRIDEALPFLRRGVAACDFMTAAVDHQRVSVMLGKALASKGDVVGACTAFRSVVTRWPNPKPRSLSVEEARAHLAKLACPL